MLDCNTIGVPLSISSALASPEPRDYRGAFVYTEKHQGAHRYRDALLGVPGELYGAFSFVKQYSLKFKHKAQCVNHTPVVISGFFVHSLDRRNLLMGSSHLQMRKYFRILYFYAFPIHIFSLICNMYASVHALFFFRLGAFCRLLCWYSASFSSKESPFFSQ